MLHSGHVRLTGFFLNCVWTGVCDGLVAVRLDGSLFEGIYAGSGCCKEG